MPDRVSDYVIGPVRKSPSSDALFADTFRIKVKVAQRLQPFHGWLDPAEDEDFENDYLRPRYLTKTTVWTADGPSSGSQVETMDPLTGDVDITGAPDPEDDPDFDDPVYSTAHLARDLELLAIDELEYPEEWSDLSGSGAFLSAQITWESDSSLRVRKTLFKFTAETPDGAPLADHPGITVDHRFALKWVALEDTEFPDAQFQVDEDVTATALAYIEVRAPESAPESEIEVGYWESEELESLPEEEPPLTEYHTTLNYVIAGKCFPLIGLESQRKAAGLRKNGLLAWDGSAKVYKQFSTTGSIVKEDATLVTYTGVRTVNNYTGVIPAPRRNFSSIGTHSIVWPRLSWPITFAQDSGARDVIDPWYMHSAEDFDEIPFFRAYQQYHRRLEIVSATVAKYEGPYLGINEDWKGGTEELIITLSDEYTTAQLKSFIDTKLNEDWSIAYGANGPEGLHCYTEDPRIKNGAGGGSFFIATHAAFRWTDPNEIHYSRSRVRWRPPAPVAFFTGQHEGSISVDIPVTKHVLDLGTGLFTKTNEVRNATYPADENAPDFDWEELDDSGPDHVWYVLDNARWEDMPRRLDRPRARYGSTA